MLDFILPLFCAIGFVVSVGSISYFCFSLKGKFNDARERKQANEKHLMTLLESINQKLSTKP